MPIVPDASIAVSWAFDDEASPLGIKSIEFVRRDGGIVPSLWWFEIRNALIMNERRGRPTEAITAAFLRELSLLPITIDRTPGEDVLTLARRHRLSVYDASYLELAARMSLPLATLDPALIRAALREKIAVIGD